LSPELSPSNPIEIVGAANGFSGSSSLDELDALDLFFDSFFS